MTWYQTKTPNFAVHQCFDDFAVISFGDLSILKIAQAIVFAIRNFRVSKGEFHFAKFAKNSTSKSFFNSKFKYHLSHTYFVDLFHITIT